MPPGCCLQHQVGTCAFFLDVTLPKTNIAMENGPGLKMYVLLKMEIFHCYVSLPEGNLKMSQQMLWFHWTNYSG